MKANYNAISGTPILDIDTVIEVNNYPIRNIIINFPRVSKAEFLSQDDRKKEEYIKGYWKLKSLKK